MADEPAKTTKIEIVYISGSYAKPEYLSLLQTSPDDLGIAGARQALGEINTTGRFLAREYDLKTITLKADGSFDGEAREALTKSKLVVADLEAADLLKLADLPEEKDALILDVRTHDDVLRQKDCRHNTFHISLSTSMKTDALGQYLISKRWMRWFLLRGTTSRDAAYAADVQRTAKRYGAKIVEDRSYGYDAGSRRVDTGYQQIQTQMPLATRNAPEHDILFVADTNDTFGDYLPYSTSEPRPVVGTQGLVATSWSPAFQEYSALQMQHRFQVLNHRVMQERDYASWLAIRAIGEAVIRSKKTSVPDLAAFMRSPEFDVAGFKGQALSFRPWDQQLRQPILLSTQLMVTSMSPQAGFLHPKFLTDTLGFDEPETQCHLAS